MAQHILGPATSPAQHWPLFQKAAGLGPVIDLAWGQGRNGLFPAARGDLVGLTDRSGVRLPEVLQLARQNPQFRLPPSAAGARRPVPRGRILHYFQGIKEKPPWSAARIVCCETDLAGTAALKTAPGVILLRESTKTIADF